MNDERRKRIAAALAKVEEARSELETIRDEEQEALDNRPESFMNTEDGAKSADALDVLEDIINGLGEATSREEEVTG